MEPLHLIKKTIDKMSRQYCNQTGDDQTGDDQTGDDQTGDAVDTCRNACYCF